ncbi:MAG TPA: hypothetical protein VLU23_19555 [Pseudolabrys sp.]|nr:hypothetical protein [Pseudolabrys sp.]
MSKAISAPYIGANDSFAVCTDEINKAKSASLWPRVGVRYAMRCLLWVDTVEKLHSHNGQNFLEALARRLAVIMHRIWVDGTEFRWTREVTKA